MGELTISGCEPRLRLRFNDGLLPTGGQTRPIDVCNDSKVNLEKVSELFERPAAEILLLTNPYFVAEACEPYDVERARQIIELMIAGHDPHRWQHDVAWAYNYKGRKAQDEKRWCDARGAFQTAINIWPAFAVARNDYYWVLKEQEKAGQSDCNGGQLHQLREIYGFDRVHHDPYDLDARLDLAAQMEEDHGDKAHVEDQYRFAVTLGQAIINRDPDDTWGHVLAGYALIKLGEVEKARTILTRAVELNPRRWSARLYLMKVLVEEYQHPEYRSACRMQTP